MELKVTKEKVLAAAAECSAAKDTLKTLFPEAFEEDKYFDLLPLVRSDSFSVVLGLSAAGIYDYILVANSYAPDHLRGKCFYLPGVVNWEFSTPEHGDGKLLVPSRKYVG